MTDVRHPCPWNRKALAAAADRIVQILGERPLRVLDPYAGVGRVHELRERGFETVGGELEPEWAASSDHTIVADALAFPADDGAFDAVLTSVVWGNRMSDSHDARERCQACGGIGTYRGEQCGCGPGVRHVAACSRPARPCEKCDGAGRRDYRRNTYRHALGRAPSVGSSAVMQFGPAYRRHHQAWIVEAARLVPPGGVIVVNAANHIRAGVEVDVVGWWVSALVGNGLLLRAVDWVPAGKLRQGANHDLRVDGEVNIVCQRRP